MEVEYYKSVLSHIICVLDTLLEKFPENDILFTLHDIMWRVHSGVCSDISIVDNSALDSLIEPKNVVNIELLKERCEIGKKVLADSRWKYPF